MASFNTPLQQVVQFDKYAKWLPNLNRRETWEETCDRVIYWLQQQVHQPALDIPWSHLWDAMYKLEVMPSMRIVQMAGPSLDRCHVGGYNCAYTTLESPTDLAELLYILMQGTGVGYSVEKQYVNQWPRVQFHKIDTSGYYQIGDSTEGWCNAFHVAIGRAMEGLRTGFSYDRIRPEGVWLHTKGGRASGPEPLKKLLKDTQDIILDRQGGFLRPFDLHRLACKAAEIVQVGGVRRASLMCLFDADDEEMRDCKNGEFWHQFPELSQANNSAVYLEGSEFPTDAWVRLGESQTGEPGIFRRPSTLPNRSVANWGTNPCGEIILRPRQFCNLSQAVARSNDTITTLHRKVELASIFGTIQSTLTTFNYLRPMWKENCEAERLLGVDITGVQDCPVLHKVPNRMTLGGLKQTVEVVNQEYAKILDINPSVSATCNKPSGNSSQLLDCASGIHPRYAAYYIRRLRLGARSPLAEYLRGVGVPIRPEVGSANLQDARVWVAEFPVKSPYGALVRDEVSAIDQFNTWLQWKQYWTSHNPSCTIYVKPDEWEDMGILMKLYWSKVGGLSFLPKDDHIYQLAPYEEITPEKYYELRNLIPPIDLTGVKEKMDNTTMAQDYACEGDKCLWEPKV